MSKKNRNSSPDSKSQRKQQIREIARQERERQERHDRRVRWAWQGGIAAVVVAAVAVIAIIIVTSAKPAASASGPKNMLSDGIVFTGDDGSPSVVKTEGLADGDDPVPTDLDSLGDAVDVTVYLDYMCPYCGQFEQANGEQLTSLVSSGDITLEVHPMTFLDNASMGTEYSSRSANAAACVANYEPSSFLDLNAALFMNQPEENSEGLTDEQLWQVAQKAGVSNEKVQSCIDDHTFMEWAQQATDRVLKKQIPNADDGVKLTGTPTIIIDGKAFEGDITDPKALAAEIQKAAKERAE